MTKFLKIKVKNEDSFEQFDLDVFEKNLSDATDLLMSNFENEYTYYESKIQESFNKPIQTLVDHFRKKAKKDMKRQLAIKVKQTIDTHAKLISLNDIHEQVNRGELTAGESASKAGLKQFKKWITQFDTRVRDWHDVVNHQTREMQDYFDVPVGTTGMVEKAESPKAPGMSALNSRNCRCYMEYEV